MPKPNDALVVANCPQHRLRVLFADVAESAETLTERHACGPTAALVLAESLAAVALLSADLEAADETVSLRVDFDGPIGGVFVEAAGGGDLRGYTRRKILADHDHREDLDLADAMGSGARAQVLRAKSTGEIVSQAAFVVGSGLIRDALQRYYTQSLQIPTRASLFVASYDGRTDFAHALAVQCLPDGDAAHFERLNSRFGDGTVARRLEVDVSLDAIRELLDLPDLRISRTRPLAFGCRCSRQRAEAALSALPTTEIQDALKAGRSQHITCHMCGENYAFTAEQLAALSARQNNPHTP